MSDLDRMLQEQDFDIWSEAGQEGEPDDVLAIATNALVSVATDLQALAARLDEQSKANSDTLAKQLQDINKTMMEVLSSNAQLGKAVEALSRAVTAPKRIVKDSQGKPVGVEVMNGA